MDFIDRILSLALSIHRLSQEVKGNKRRCQRVAQRVKALEELVMAVKLKGPDQTIPDVNRALRELKITLESAEQLITKYTSSSFLNRIINAYNHGEEFGVLNERLNDAYQVLSLSLQVDHGDKLHKVFEITSRQAEDEKDRKEDHAELQELLSEKMDTMQETQDTTLKEVQDIKQNMRTMIETINKPRIIPQDIREIKPDELTYELPKRPFMTTPISEVYRGEYNKFTVAIKRYTYPITTSPNEVRQIFRKEVETMRRFESPNILRMFGICVQDESGPSPNYLIIMEYCEKGSLRQVLDSQCKLPWTRKARICLDAAQGLYRLHQTEEKFKLHGSINSSKFLVAEGYRVKLGGLELAKTETSLRRSKERKSSSLCYCSPQQMADVNYIYNKESEMYSFGIVLWEIATRKKPFEDCSREVIYKRVCEDKYQEPLPDDCPKKLGELINACRSCKCFNRPSAGVVVDKLRKVVEQLEED
ncbi:mixed lineage kinase domain-like protein [Lampris incognitus]|uniref:mixed lineage kinase domain-like protein n=1 Tax=Lampris incognitus TaxID=2546036 RepID=UPI0024B62340|nr:mixed lineage kinase domain-like protein [Lampris incognitus]